MTARDELPPLKHYAPRPAKTGRLNQRIDARLKEKLADEAHAKHLDETSIVTIALNEYFEKHGDPPPRKPPTP